MSKRRRWNSSETGTLAILGFQRVRKDLEVPVDPSARSVPVVLGGPEDLEVPVDPSARSIPVVLEPPEDLEALVALEVPAGLEVRAGLEFLFGMLGPSPTGRGPYRGLRTPHEL